MTKSELIAALAARYPQLAARDTDYAVKTVLDAMTQALASGQRIEIRGFGSFSLSQRSPRIGRNPKSGEQVLDGVDRLHVEMPDVRLREAHVVLDDHVTVREDLAVGEADIGRLDGAVVEVERLDVHALLFGHPAILPDARAVASGVSRSISLRDLDSNQDLTAPKAVVLPLHHRGSPTSLASPRGGAAHRTRLASSQ